MDTYDFLRNYVREQATLGARHFILQEGIQEQAIAGLEGETGIDLPEELKEFYAFSYGAQLDEYEMLTVPKIVALMGRLRHVYGGSYRTSILPFAVLKGTGDFLACDTEMRGEGGLQILDCFHELPPNAWGKVCFGLENWLKEMVKTDFRPFWL